MSKPTKKMYKHACHLAEYLQCTKDVNLTMKWSYPGRSALDERKLMRDEAQALQLGPLATAIGLVTGAGFHLHAATCTSTAM